MAAPTYFGSASSPADNVSQTDNATLTVTPPANMLAGDLAILVPAVRLAAPSSTLNLNATGGQTWTKSSATGANICALALHWCRFNGTWSANPSCTFANEAGTVPVSFIMHVFRPPSGSGWYWSVEVPFAQASEASASPIVVTGVTPTHTATVVLACWMLPSAATFSALSGAGWTGTGTTQYRNAGGSFQVLAFAHQLRDAPAATGDASYTPSAAVAGISFTMAWSALMLDVGYPVNHRR